MVVESHPGRRIFVVNLKARMGLELFLKNGDAGCESFSPPQCKKIARAETRSRKAGSALMNVVVKSHPSRSIFVVNLRTRCDWSYLF